MTLPNGLPDPAPLWHRFNRARGQVSVGGLPPYPQRKHSTFGCLAGARSAGRAVRLLGRDLVRVVQSVQPAGYQPVELVLRHVPGRVERAEGQPDHHLDDRVSQMVEGVMR